MIGLPWVTMTRPKRTSGVVRLSNVELAALRRIARKQRIPLRYVVTQAAREYIERKGKQ